MFVPYFLWDLEARQLQRRPAESIGEKVFQPSVTGGVIGSEKVKSGDYDTYRTSRGSRGATRSQQTSRTLRKSKNTPSSDTNFPGMS